MFRLRELRKEKGITQLKLAMDLGMNQNSISRYETVYSVKSRKFPFSYIEISFCLRFKRQSVSKNTFIPVLSAGISSSTSLPTIIWRRNVNARVFNQIRGEGEALGAIMVSADDEGFDPQSVKRAQKFSEQ